LLGKKKTEQVFSPFCKKSDGGEEFLLITYYHKEPISVLWICNGMRFGLITHAMFLEFA
jgi:hypothetical protein